MVSSILSLVLVIAIAIAAIVIVSTAGRPIIDEAIDADNMRQAENSMKSINKHIRELVAEGPNSSRIFEVYFPNKMNFNADDDSVIFSLTTTAPLFDYLSRSFIGSVLRISEEDVFCETSDNPKMLSMENSFLYATFQYIEETEPMHTINTKNIIMSMTQKQSSRTIFPVDTSITIDDDPSSSSGLGYTELLQQGRNSLCVVHVHVQSTATYDVYYKLYSGADFLVMEIRNVK